MLKSIWEGKDPCFSARLSAPHTVLKASLLFCGKAWIRGNREQNYSRQQIWVRTWKLHTVQCHYMTSNLLFLRTLYTYYMLKYRHCYSIIKMFVITEIKGEVKKQHCITSMWLLTVGCRHRKKSHQHEARSAQAFGSFWKTKLIGRRAVLWWYIAVKNYFLLVLQVWFLEQCFRTWNAPVEMPQGTGCSGSCAILC